MAIRPLRAALLLCAGFTSHALHASPDTLPTGFAGIPWLSSPTEVASLLKTKLTDECAQNTKRRELAAFANGLLACSSALVHVGDSEVRLSFDFNENNQLVGVVAARRRPAANEPNQPNNVVRSACAGLQRLTETEYGWTQPKVSLVLSPNFYTASWWEWQSQTARITLSCQFDLDSNVGMFLLNARYEQRSR